MTKIRKTIKGGMIMNGRMIKRHSKLSIFLHWFNAVSWMFLLATGIGLIKNPDLQPVGMWWTNLMWGLFGSGENLLLGHIIGGIVWAGVFLIYAILGIKQVAQFLREIFSYSPNRDFMWLLKKGIQMTLGTRALKKFGDILEKRGASPEIAAPRIPEQGFYNVGQKLFAVPSVLGRYRHCRQRHHYGAFKCIFYKYGHRALGHPDPFCHRRARVCGIVDSHLHGSDCRR